jgi:hypothetical protein
LGHLRTTLQFAFSEQQDPQTQFFNYVHDKDLLLVLDNFEYLLGGTGLITDLLQHAPQPMADILDA